MIVLAFELDLGLVGLVPEHAHNNLCLAANFLGRLFVQALPRGAVLSFGLQLLVSGGCCTNSGEFAVKTSKKNCSKRTFWCAWMARVAAAERGRDKHLSAWLPARRRRRRACRAAGSGILWLVGVLVDVLAADFVVELVQSTFNVVHRHVQYCVAREPVSTNAHNLARNGW